MRILNNLKNKDLLRLVGVGLLIFIIYKVVFLKIPDCLRGIKMFYIVAVLLSNFFSNIRKNIKMELYFEDIGN
jgi:hypothetical protein